MKPRKPEKSLVVGLDVGTSKIACLILKFDGENLDRSEGIGGLLGQSSFRVIGAATTRSRGLRFGEIDAMGETERAIRTAVQQAQKMAQTRNQPLDFSGSSSVQSCTCNLRARIQ